MTKTQHYNLNQWDAGDRVLRTDFNSDNAKTDNALHAQAEKQSALEETLQQHADALEKRGNCQFYVDSYVGDGNKTTPSCTFPAKPMVILVSEAESGNRPMLAWRGMTTAGLLTSTSNYFTLTWEGNTVTWFYGGGSEAGLNCTGRSYQILALLDVSA